MSRKYFTVEEANRTLPLVRRVVGDIVDEYRRWRENVYRYELIAATRAPGQPETDEQVALRRLVDQSAHKINGYMEELALVGCLFKGFEEGLVDFYSKLEGRDVFLCWKLGEPEVSYWHELDAGYAGRRPLAPRLAEGRTR
ncbi:MAG: hypothetical protein KatS3mg081_2177 [Gemmatimonadales bacterium]|nr:hypothetical protein HRbin33_01068 [bacterium HR33]GIW52822.1 MAG: hypothetical protein KatS3mg081_2177 [Gemmatimonadales bacterium]